MKILRKKIDVKAGKLTFEQRITLGKIFQSETDTEAGKFEKVFVCLHDYKPRVIDYKRLIDYFTEIVEGLKFWFEQEKTLLHYMPTMDEVSAGIEDYSKKVGEFGTVKAIAKQFGCDPDVVLKWEYAKVFGILYTDLEEFKFQKKFNQVLERKYKTR
ncbi:MAG: hypothetical protein LBS50_11230 [Prevotellaceae bacterium]|jgi:hypothetical protein|nr:hypothetical protein [Prevotellaceae bacterium]